MSRTNRLAAIAMAAVLALPGAASAVTFVIDRQSDSVATITASGTLPAGLAQTFGTTLLPANRLDLVGAFTGAGGNTPVGDLFIDGDPFDAYQTGEPTVLSFTDIVAVQAGGTLSGSVTITLGAGLVWAAVGTTGDVEAATFFGRFQDVGDFSVTGDADVPLPASGLLLLSALGGLRYLRHRG